jgi:3-oxoacyl-[acyl-carrier-protein] synthase-3
MTKITTLGTIVPPMRLDNVQEGLRFGAEEGFVRNKIGFTSISRKEPCQGASDLCVAAWGDLKRQRPDMASPDVIMVCTQNPDRRIPHTSSLVHHRLELPESCACLDVSLGCSGYVSTVSLALGYMRTNNLRTGVVFTADPYSEVLDPEDRNTWLLFGDAATATLLCDDGDLEMGPVTNISVSAEHEALSCEHGGLLRMDGRRIFNFAMHHVPRSVDTCLAGHGLGRNDIDLCLLHQATSYMVENLRRRLDLPQEKVPFLSDAGGNTVASTIPMLLARYLADRSLSRILLCGFGVGLAVSAALLTRRS